VSSDQSSSLIFLVIIVAAFWFLVLRPARKRSAQATQLQASIQLGDRVMLTSGIFGYVTGLGNETLVLEVADGVEITTHRQAVARVVPPEETPEEYEYADELSDEDGADGERDGQHDEQLAGERDRDEPGDEQPMLGATPAEDQSQTAEGRTDDDRR